MPLRGRRRRHDAWSMSRTPARCVLVRHEQRRFITGSRCGGL